MMTQEDSFNWFSLRMERYGNASGLALHLGLASSDLKGALAALHCLCVYKWPDVYGHTNFAVCF